MRGLGARSLLVWVGAVALLAGCGDERAASEVTSPAPIEEETRSPGSPPSLDELRALPYAGYSPAGEDAGKVGVVRLDRERSAPGYNLTTQRTLCLAELLSPTGRALGRWTLPGCKHWSNARLLDDGDLLVVGMDEPDERPIEARYLARLAWDGALRWKRSLAAHHDVAELPGGGLLALTAAYAPAERIGGETLYDNRLTRLSGDGEILDETSVYELFGAGDGRFGFQPVAAKETQDGRVAVDLFHLNSVQPAPGSPLAERDDLYASRNALLCSRHQDVVAVVDRERGELVWWWGRGELSGPHDASWLPSGNLLIFDNGLDRGWSRVIELDPLSREIAWEHRGDPPESFFTLSRGSAQRLPNGNTLIAESDRGRAFEVTKGGEIVWEYFSPYLNDRGERATIVRMRRHSEQQIDRLRAALGPPSLVEAPAAQ